MVEAEDEEFIFGMPKSAYFRVGKKKAIIIGCSEYDELRQIEGKEGFADLPEALNDIKVVKASLKRLGFFKENIDILVNPNY